MAVTRIIRERTSVGVPTVEGLDRLAVAERLARAGSTLRYRQFLDDFPLVEVTTIWDDTARDPENIVRRCKLQRMSCVVVFL